MEHKRITIFCGHYGSGKSNLAVNFARSLRDAGERVTLADLDIVNPYFRSADSKAELERQGIRLVVSEYANTNLDAPALPAEIYSLCDPRLGSVVIDLGGDDRGALALGRLRHRILQENDFSMVFVLNGYRPLTRTPEEAAEVIQEVAAAAGLPITALVNNSNLGEETTAEAVLDSVAFAEKTAAMTALPLLGTCAEKSLCPALAGKLEPLFPLELQEKYY